MDRQVFRDKLHKVLRDTLLEEMQQYFDQQFEAHQQLTRYISALDRKYDDSTVVKEGFPGIFSNINDGLKSESQKGITEVYLSAVDRLAKTFPEETVWLQDEERFAIQETDSLLVSVGKSGKRLGRSVSYTWYKASKKAAKFFKGSVNGWQPWTQTVPLRRLVQYHLQEVEVVKDWLVALERIRLHIIRDIEDLLIRQGGANEEAGFPEFAESLQEMLQSKQSVLHQKLSEAVNKMESEIYWKVKKAGTIERSRNLYDQKRLASKREDFKEELQKASGQWRLVQQLLIDRGREIMRFMNLGAEIHDQSQDFKTDFVSIFRHQLGGPMGELSELLQNAIQQVDRQDPTDAVLDLKNQLSSFVEQKLSTPIQKLLENQVCSRKVEHFFEELLMEANQVSQEVKLIFDEKLEGDLPSVSQKQVEWRQLLIRALREQLINPLQPSRQKYEDFLAETLQGIRAVENIIEVNLESALTVHEQSSEDDEAEHPAKIAKEALQRISNSVDDLQTKISEKSGVIEQIVDEGTANFTESLLTLLHEGDAKELQLLNAKYKVKETTKDWRTVLDSRWVRAQDRLMLWSRFGWQRANKLGASIRDVAGFKAQEIEELKRADIASYLSETDQKMKELPYIYRRLFDFQAVADERFYVSLPESAITFKKAYEQWQQSYPAAFAIVGEKGGGKSTFLDLTLASELGEEKVIKIDFLDTIWTETDLVKELASGFEISGVESVQQIIERLQEAKGRRVVSIEGIQNCFVRNINGYTAIEKLCYLISETSEHVFWAVSCSRYAWNFLDETLQVNEYFSHIALCDTLDAEQVKNVILNRHRASGYTLVFEPGKETLKSRAYRKLKDQEEQAQEYLQKNYFQKLTELAEGNASVAMIFWIRSISSFDDTYFYIQPLEITSIEMIADLSPQVLFALAAFVLHDTLSDEDLSMVLNMTTEESRLLINRLHSRGLLVKREDMYTINHLMYRQIVRVLKERNIIHLV